MTEDETRNPHDEPTEDLNPTVRGGHPTDSQLDPIPKSIGPYRILERLGEGGMGEVYLAEQTQPVRRRVALKVIKQGMDTKRVVARFEAERQALAMMNHPCVARVFEAGSTEAGQPYFAMEYVKGLPITEHCNRQRLSTRERLDLFMQVCEGVQHAHQKAIIHRDLKPSNLLVAYQDGKATPKIIDFGVAKAVDHRLTERTLYTEMGVLIGTPEYMSPEQAEMSGQDVDTRTDVYSLGVVLYELLVGALPFDSKELRGAGFDEIRRKIREDQPSTPSRRLSTLGGGRSTESAECRGTDLPTLRSQLKGDLDWITMRALEKDRARRYGSPSDLAADLERHLTSQPILARPPSTLYRLGKFTRRNKALVGGMVATLVVLLAGIAVSTVQRLEAIRQRDEAIRQRYIANITAAESSLRLGDIVPAKERLDACPEDLRGWEWSYLQGQLDESRMILSGHEGTVLSTAFSPDGTRIASASEDRTVRVWDATSGETLAVLAGHEASVLTSAFTPDGARIVSVSEDQTVKFWDAATGELIATTEGFENARQPVVISSDGRRLVSTTPKRGLILLWDTATGRPLAELGEQDSTEVGSGMTAGAFGADGARFVSGHFNGSIRLWDLDSGTRLQTMTGPDRRVDSVAFSPDGKRIVSGSRDVRLWDAASGDLLATFEHEESVDRVAFGPDGRHVASVSTDKIVRLWDTVSGELAATWVGHEGWLKAVAFSPGGKLVASAGQDGTVRVWDALPDRWMNHPPGGVRGIAFSPDGARIVSAGMDGTVRVWSVATGELLGILTGHADRVHSVAFSPDGERIASLAAGETRVWDAATGELLRVLHGTDAVWQVVFSPDGKRLASSADEYNIGVWDAVGGELLTTLVGHEAVVVGLAFSPDGNRIVSGAQDRTVRLWDAASGELLRTMGHEDTVWSVAFSPDGKRIASGAGSGNVSGSGDKSVRIWDAASGELLMTLKQTDDQIVSVAFSPDGRRIAGGSSDTTVRLWDAATGDFLATFKEPSNTVTGVAFSPDGKTLAAGVWAGKGNSVLLWQTDVDRGSAAPIRPWCVDKVGTARASLQRGDLTRARRLLAMCPPDLRDRDWSELWEETDLSVSVLRGHTGAVDFATYSPDGRRIASASYDTTIRLWDAASGEVETTLGGHRSWVYVVAFSPDGARLASASRDGTAMLWDPRSGELLTTLTEQTGDVNFVRFSPDGARLATASDDKIVRLWDAATGEPLVSMEGHERWALSVGFSPDGTRVVSSSVDQTVRIWDAASGEPLRTLSGHVSSVFLAAFSPDGTRIASASDDATVRLWDAESGELLQTLSHEAGTRAVAFSPDGTRIATGSNDGTLHLWDAAAGELLATLTGHEMQVWSVEFSPDGRRIVSSSRDKTVRLWDVAAAESLDR